MNKVDKTGGKYFLQWESHSKHTTKSLCMLLERQCLVDIAISCGSSTMHAHKCILASNSPYFKEHLENKAVEQIILNGLDFSVIKAIIEFIYSGECVVSEEHMKYFIAMARLLRILVLESIFSENEYQSVSAEDICIPPPQFICKPPKYPTVYKPFITPPPMPASKLNFNPPTPVVSQFAHAKFSANPLNPPASSKQRKSLGSEADKACVKEAQASRIALANLRKAMASTPQVHSFIVEESFNETTVENFIPSVDDGTLGGLISGATSSGGGEHSKTLNLIPLSDASSLTADKIKHILGNDQVEIMFQTSDGNFVNVSDEVLLNLSKGGLQYQVVDENGHIGELQELKTLPPTDGAAVKGGTGNFVGGGFQMQPEFEPENLSMHHTDLISFDHGVKYSSTSEDKSGKDDHTTTDMDIEPPANEDDKESRNSLKFTPDMFFADLPDSGDSKVTEAGDAPPVTAVKL